MKREIQREREIADRGARRGEGTERARVALPLGTVTNQNQHYKT